MYKLKSTVGVGTILFMFAVYALFGCNNKDSSHHYEQQSNVKALSPQISVAVKNCVEEIIKDEKTKEGMTIVHNVVPPNAVLFFEQKILKKVFPDLNVGESKVPVTIEIEKSGFEWVTVTNYLGQEAFARYEQDDDNITKIIEDGKISIIRKQSLGQKLAVWIATGFLNDAPRSTYEGFWLFLDENDTEPRILGIGEWHSCLGKNFSISEHHLSGKTVWAEPTCWWGTGGGGDGRGFRVWMLKEGKLFEIGNVDLEGYWTEFPGKRTLTREFTGKAKWMGEKILVEEIAEWTCSAEDDDTKIEKSVTITFTREFVLEDGKLIEKEKEEPLPFTCA